jgi:hypothetical protein
MWSPKMRKPKNNVDYILSIFYTNDVRNYKKWTTLHISKGYHMKFNEMYR